MRMPGMDGAALLGEIRVRNPATVRILLSGYAEPTAISRALPIAHQFVSKPCEVDQLKALIERACSLRRILGDPSLRALLGTLDTLPSAPEVYDHLVAILEDSKAGSPEVARIVEQDVALCAKLLQIVNSAFFGLASRVESVEGAVVHLGLTQLRAIVLWSHVFARADVVGPEQLEEMQRDSLIVGRIVKRLMPDAKQADRAFTAALLHDLGQLVLAGTQAEQYQSLVRQSKSGEHSLVELERLHFGATHAQVGGYLLALWGLPASIVDAVSLHHEPRFEDNNDPRLVAVIHVASSFVEAAAEGLPLAKAKLAVSYLEKAAVTAELPHWQEVAEQELRKMELARSRSA
jgi:HD-like signal output (HDOD) protein